MRRVESEVDGPFFFETEEYGYEVPDELWAEYEALERRLGEIRERIYACPYHGRPAPEPGTLAYAMWKMYRDELRPQAEFGARLFARWRDMSSQDDGSLRRLERALAPARDVDLGEAPEST